MINLAGQRDADVYIRQELKNCGIEIVEGELNKGEVPYTLTGKLGQFTFTRAWYYWCVEGPHAVHLAKILHDHPAANKTVRAVGDCTSPAIEGPYVITRFNQATGQQVLETSHYNKEMEQAEKLFKDRHPKTWERMQAEYCSADNPEEHPGFIMSYHVDSELGLYLLAESIKLQGAYPEFKILKTI